MDIQSSSLQRSQNAVSLPRSNLNNNNMYGAIIAGASALLNAKMQSDTNKNLVANQSDLLAKQQAYQTRQNENMYSTYRRSLEGAGMNINSALGGYPNTASSVPSPAPQTAPQVSPDVALLLQQAPLVKAQANLANAQAQETLSRIPKNEADIGKTIQETANLAQQHGLLEFENQVQKQKFDVFMQRQFADIDKTEAETSNINIDTKVKDLESQLDEASLEDRKKIYTQTLYEIISRKNLNLALRKQAFANANKAYAEASFTQAQEHRLRKLLDVEWYRLDQEGKKLGLDMDFVIAQTASVLTKQDWIDFENEMKAFGMGADVLAKILKFTPYGRKH